MGAAGGARRVSVRYGPVTLLAPTPSPSSPNVFTTPEVDCKADALCSRVFDVTHNEWLAHSSCWVIVKPLRIIAIILAAMLIR